MPQAPALTALVFTFLLAGCSSEAAFMLSQPIDHAVNRPTPLAFGIHVTPDAEENPIDPPERFSGYHVGLDYEVTEEELDADVPIYAICSGTVIYSGFAEGYGGLIVEECRMGRESVTVLHGHLLIESLPPKDTEVQAGDTLSILAPAKSHDSDGNRKHLHLGIHRGEASDVRGYVQSEDELTEFIDPKDILPQFGMEGVLPDMTPYWEEVSTPS